MVTVGKWQFGGGGEHGGGETTRSFLALGTKSVSSFVEIRQNVEMEGNVKVCQALKIRS
jgi:hypothetical protein